MRAAPHENAANEALVALLAKSLGVPLRSVEITGGTTSRVKRVTVSGDADLELWNATTPSVLITGAVRRRHLLDGSGYDGDHPEDVAFRNRTRRGTYVYLDVYLPEQGASSSSYRATITTAR